MRRTQDLIGRQMAVENSSYYAPLATDISELEFVNAVLDHMAREAAPEKFD